ncbi:2-octaprenyl-6-methoxyphenyl hydroxylase [Alteromonas sp. C1M14]|uniref:2-octaprenyl-6-methoxyphenyl hydroxylase n=1 Tax=Alteromonas sp. C1M14 TaxID=2841567 RepID=UPI001C0A30CF|nr:2-octaprenyl-6-methoxyphenyl hydroxylase [Alteromonas sp. C1M14]
MVDTDVLIIGGGTVGSVVARGLLKHTSLSVTLIEANSYSHTPHHPGFDDRVIALSKRTVEELTDLGVKASSVGSVPIHHIQVSDKGAAGLCRLNAQDYQTDSFGEVVSLRRLGDALQLHDNTARFTLHCPAKVDQTSRTQNGVSVTLDNGTMITAKLLVLADGGRSFVHQQLGFERTVDDYQQTAIVVNALTAQPHHHRAYERFTHHGPVAFLPFNPESADNTANAHGFSVVWTLPPAMAENMMSATDKAFIRELQQAFGWRQGAITQVGKRFSYPLSLQQTKQVFTHRAVVCGNAAQMLHPIAGQGFNLGLRDAVSLVSCLKAKKDPGAFSVLSAYQQQRSKDKQTTISLTDGLVRLFSNDMPGLIAVRNVGLMAMDNCAYLKQQFVRQATGFARNG